MYTENPARDFVRFCKACASNQVARFAPGFYVRATAQTGRGSEPETPADIADYFLRCFHDYFQQLEVAPEAVPAYLESKLVLEYGPGDTLGVALLMIAYGAQRVSCVDRFPLQADGARSAPVYAALLERLSPERRARAQGAFRVAGDVAGGFDPARIQYVVNKRGVSDARDAYDLIISRAVLEHVDDLPRTFADMRAALTPGGVAVHQVDLKSHGLDRYRSLDFLTWPGWAYRAMFSHKGFPNRWRADTYRALAARVGLYCRRFEATQALTAEELQPIRAHLARAFRDVPLDTLTWLGFWMVLEQRD